MKAGLKYLYFVTQIALIFFIVIAIIDLILQKNTFFSRTYFVPIFVTASMFIGYMLIRLPPDKKYKSSNGKVLFCFALMVCLLNIGQVFIQNYFIEKNMPNIVKVLKHSNKLNDTSVFEESQVILKNMKIAVASNTAYLYFFLAIIFFFLLLGIIFENFLKRKKRVELN